MCDFGILFMDWSALCVILVFCLWIGLQCVILVLCLWIGLECVIVVLCLWIVNAYKVASVICKKPVKSSSSSACQPQ